MITKHVVSLISLCAVVVTAVGQLTAAEKPEQLAQTAAEQWLTLVDAGKFAESWQSAAAYFKGAVTEAQWKTSLDAFRKPLGALVSRKLKSAKYTKTAPGAPDGEYVILQFETSFANKKDSVETVTPMLDKDGKWKVSGYFIK
jgi:hypothetical protein